MFFFDDQPVDNKDNSTNLSEISIIGLFGNSNVKLKFTKEANIYIGENGLGKTTILNCIYYVLHGEYEKLVGIPFVTIIFKFNNGREHFINKEDVIKFVYSRNKKRYFREKELEQIIEDSLEQYKLSVNSLFDSYIQDTIAQRIISDYGMSYSSAKSFVFSYFVAHSELENGDENRIIEMQEAVSSLVSERVIYLTTYRRIEKDYSGYFSLEKKNRYDDNSLIEEDALIRFGMKDVTKSINEILKIISDRTNQGFSKMSGILLSKYVNSSINSENREKDFDSTLLKIVLDRLEKQIGEEDKQTILKLVESGEINNEEYRYLRDLIDELISSYNQLKKFDEKIKGFTETCNKYLNDKSFVYNPSEITLNLLSNKDDSEIDLSILSSGEKQIVSLFSRLYLENDKKCILLIDEPELSISIRWQKMLLPDIIRSGNCSLLITVTHSPFIFDNELDAFTQDIGYCFIDK